MDLGKHAVFIWASYGAVGIVLVSLVVWLILDGVRLKRRISDLEQQSGRRRS